jgi:hypothetical protein
MDHPSAGVELAPAFLGDEAHPGRPAATVCERSRDRLAKAGLRDGVGIEQDEQIAARHARPSVAGSGEAGVAAGLDHVRGRRELAGRGRGAVGGGVVDDDQLVVLAELRRERRQRPRDRLAGVMRDHDYRDPSAGHGPVNPALPGSPRCR